MRGLLRHERPRSKELVRIGTLNVGDAVEGRKAKEIGEGVKLFYKGNYGKRNGVGIAVSEALKDSVSTVRRINDRIITVRVDMKDGYWTIISVYAPQTGCSEEEKEEFYMTLDGVIRSVPEGDFLTVAGDLNGHVGTDRRGLEMMHGGRGIGCKNEDGEQITDLAVAHAAHPQPTTWLSAAHSSQRGKARR
ncbi:unnamed protein product [Nippostrongylus brasiliensis]|uniref:Endo/exonuclease/phosphatase domain-containing protein n=1 Tax=Nippostrongylus brasiliensis TaxID=27835 RepID=A0A0N4YIE0_NIPBR|nr:unnamed protein product [Nippostrongylus brasiliensis]